MMSAPIMLHFSSDMEFPCPVSVSTRTWHTGLVTMYGPATESIECSTYCSQRFDDNRVSRHKSVLLVSNESSQDHSTHDLPVQGWAPPLSRAMPGLDPRSSP